MFCRVQFDRRDLGTELVQDIDVMPMDPSENLPLSFLADSPPILVNGRLATTTPSRVRAVGVLGPSSGHSSFDTGFLTRDSSHANDPSGQYAAVST